jgi:4-amino-4-deoxy-L-arabinose transferase-like glycosyltransferase
MQRRRYPIRALILGMMLVFFGQLCFGATQLSLTSDEPAHIANGYTLLTTGDLWTVPRHGHPPLINVWNAGPLLLQEERPELSTLPGWRADLITFTSHLWDKFGSLDRLAYVTRYPNMLLAVMLIALVYRWAREWASTIAGGLAVFLMTWDPTMVAHAQLNTTDLGFTLCLFVAFYLCWKLHRRFSYATLIGIGLAGGAAMSAKASGILVPLLVCTVFAGYYLLEVLARLDSRSREGWGWQARARLVVAPAIKWFFYGAVVLFLSTFTLWATYGFANPAHAFAVHGEMLRIFFAGQQRLAFAAGELRAGGWWWYFPYAFTIKTPIPAILAYATGLLHVLLSPRKLIQRDLALWSFPLAYLLAALVSDVNIGVRHLLPLFPFLYVIASGISRPIWRGAGRGWSYIRQPLYLALGIWYIWGTAHVYPFAIAYFNELVGGAKNGYHYLVDSNVDWGQSFKALKTYMDENQVPEAWVSYATWIDPGAYGVAYHPLFPGQGTEPYFPRRYDPAPGFYAISATTLQGIALKEHDPDLYEWFRNRKPAAQPGYGLLIYEVAPHDPPAEWIAQCDVPVTPLNAEAIQEGLGRTDLRQIAFDCTQAWIYPNAGHDSGWYALYHETWTHAAPFTRARLAPAHLSYEQRHFNVVPAFALFEWQGAGPTPYATTTITVVASPITWPPAQAQSAGETYATPVDFGDTLTLVAFESIERPRDNVIEMWTTWQVREVPTRPLSLIGHLVQADAQPAIVSDGLGVLPDQWRAGDLIVQRHTFELPQGIAPGTYWLQTGAYWLDTLERLPVGQSPLGSDRVLLTAVEVGP